MNEVELKFQVPAEKRQAVEAAVAGRAPPRRQRLQAAYVDTPGRALARAGIALRLRREGRQWVQTVKGTGSDAMTRLEHNVPRGVGAQTPAVDPALHVGTEIGERLALVLAEHADAPLATLYRTDILRRTRALRTTGGGVELAFDAGAIFAADARLAVCELEIELKTGTPAAVIDAGRRWRARFGLWLDVRSKSERGDLLARGERCAPHRLAQPVRLGKHMTPNEAWTAVLRSCTDQIVVNASQIAAGEHGDEHVHQLRVGLRRLRSGLRLFEGLRGTGSDGAPAWDGAVAALFRQLGGARDLAVIESTMSADLRTALASTGVADAAPVAADAAGAPTPTPTPTQIVRSPDAQGLLLDLLAGAASVAPDADRPDGARAPEPNEPADAIASGRPSARAAADAALRDRLGRRLKRWHRAAAAAAARFDDLDAEARHTLRKRLKRLRYGLEFCADLLPRPALRRYLRRLRAVQERLGAINDVVVAIEAYRGGRDTDPHAWFALGWLAARRDALVADARKDLKAFAKAPSFRGKH